VRISKRAQTARGVSASVTATREQRKFLFSPMISKKRRRQFEFGFCVECLFSQSFITARACNSASSRDPITTLPFISTPAG
jgi:hypothetical protein